MRGLVRSPALVVILTLVTCGIYGFYWIYVMSKELNDYMGLASESPALELVLSIITCGLYLIYWSYKYAKRAGEAKLRAGLSPEDNGVLCLILAVLGLFVVNMALIQDTANKVWETAA